MIVLLILTLIVQRYPFSSHLLLCPCIIVIIIQLHSTALANGMANVGLGGGGSGGATGNQALVPHQFGGAGGAAAVGAGGQVVAAPGQQVGPPNGQ